MNKPIIIVYEGTENSGKTTIRRKVAEMLNHNTLSFERWTGTCECYAKLHNRDVNFKEIQRINNRFALSFETVLVYLYADDCDLMTRDNTDPLTGGEYDLNTVNRLKLQKLFSEWYENTYGYIKIKINTSKYSADEAAKYIYDVVKMTVNDN